MQEIEENHYSYLLSVKEREEEAKSSLLYSYKHSINGFAALLTPQEASILSGKPIYTILPFSQHHIHILIHYFYNPPLEV